MSEQTGDLTFEAMFDVNAEAARTASGVVDDPQRIWAELLTKSPVHKGSIAEVTGLNGDQQILHVPGRRYYSVFSYAGVSDVFVRKDDFDSSFYTDLGVADWLGDNILTMDGLRHRRYRNVAQEFFQPTSASAWWREKVISGLVQELVGALDPSGTDLNAQLCARLPMLTVTTAFGLDRESGLEFRIQMQIANGHYEPEEKKAAAFRVALGILDREIRARQAEPRDDMISRLAVAELEEEDGSTRRLTVEEISAFCRLIVFAGGGTTWRQFGITLFCLLNNRDQLEAVMADRSLIPNAILEASRWCPNDPMFQRAAIRDTTLEGVEIPKGAVMHLCLSSANRDPSRWENPDQFDIFRPVQRSVAFAAGHHSCLGQHVSREEMEGALNALFDRFPNIRWDPSAPPPFLSGGLLARGPGPLRVLLN